jgi:hypothetical protein
MRAVQGRSSGVAGVQELQKGQAKFPKASLDFAAFFSAPITPELLN